MANNPWITTDSCNLVIKFKVTNLLWLPLLNARGDQHKFDTFYRRRWFNCDARLHHATSLIYWKNGEKAIPHCN